MASRRQFLKIGSGVGATGLLGTFAGCTGGGDGDGSGNGGGGGANSGGDGGDGGGGDGGGGNGGDGADGGGSSDAEVVAAMVDLREPGSDQWVNREAAARNTVDDKFDWLEFRFSGGISQAESKQIFTDYAEQGVDIIFGHAFDYMNIMLELSEEYPDIAWENATGFQTGDNMAWYQCRAYQGFYASGIAAGMMTETNKLGFVCAYPIAFGLRQINALTAGAREVNPDVTTEVAYTSKWYDPPTETSAAKSLVDSGADVIAHNTNSLGPSRVASDNDGYAVGMYEAQSDDVGDALINSTIYWWETHFEKECQAVRDGSWEAVPDWGGINEDYVRMDGWGPQVPSEAQQQADDAIQAAFVEGELDIWEGTEMEGITDEELYGSLDYYIEGVEGEPPS